MATTTKTRAKASSTRGRSAGKGGRKTYSGPSPEEKLCTALVALLEQGTNPWRRDWAQLGQQGQHRNLITGQAYRGSNPAVLEMWAACRGYNLPIWIGCAQAKGKGWYPRKGSQGCYVLRPQLNKREREDENGQPVLGPDGKPEIAAWVSYKPACVFNVAELVGRDETAQQALEAAIREAQGLAVITPEPNRLQAAEAVLGVWQVPTSWGGDRAFYSPGADAITMPSREQFSTSAGLYATWAHEQAHSTGHNSRLARDLSGGFGTDLYAREELVAELAAFLVCNRLQIPSNTENHAAYLGSWAKVLKEGPRVLFKALSDATKAANSICGPEVQEGEN
jgi:antirestriction protein ArdC